MKRIFLLFLILAGFSTQAQSVISLDSCRALAVRNHYTIANAALTEQKAKYEYRAIQANRLPDISAYGDALFTNKTLQYNFAGAYLPTYVPDLATGALVPNLLLDPTGQMIIGPDGNPIFKQYAMIPPMDLKVKLNGSYMVGLKAVQPIFTGFKISTASGMAGIARKMAADNIDLSTSNLVVKVDEAYWQLVKVIQLEKLAQKYLETVQAVEKQVNDALATGLTMNNDLLKVQVKVNEAQLMLSKAKNGHVLAAMNLCNLTGLPLTTQIIPEDIEQVEVVMPESLMTEGSIANRPDYRLLDRQIEMKRKQVDLVRSDYLPRVGLAATYGYMDGLKVQNEKLLESSGSTVIAQITIPIFHWGEGYNKTASAKADLKIAENERDNLHQLMELEQQQYRLMLSDAMYRIQLTTKSLEQAEENMKVMNDRYELGLETISALLEAQAQWQKASAEQVESISEYRIAKVKYQKATGEL